MICQAFTEFDLHVRTIRGVLPMSSVCDVMWKSPLWTNHMILQQQSCLNIYTFTVAVATDLLTMSPLVSELYSKGNEFDDATDYSTPSLVHSQLEIINWLEMNLYLEVCLQKDVTERFAAASADVYTLIDPLVILCHQRLAQTYWSRPQNVSFQLFFLF